MRLSLNAQKNVYAQETGDYPIILVDLTDPTLSQPIRISTDATTRLSLTTDEQVVYGTVHNFKEYLFCPMEINWPSEEEESAPRTELSISNIGRELVEIVRGLTKSPKLSMTFVMASDPNIVESKLAGFVFSDVTIDQMTITGSLVLEIMTNEPFPYRTFTPSTASGLYKS